MKRNRDRRLDELARLFDQVRAYAKAGPDKTVDWTLEALVPVVERKLPLVTTVNRAQDIRDAVAFADRVKVNLVISGGTDANLVAPLLKEKNIPVILGNILVAADQTRTRSTPPTISSPASWQRPASRLRSRPPTAPTSASLPYHAAMSVAWGMKRDDAIKALTINAAEMLGVADRVGSLEPGKDANLFISKGDPLEIKTAVTNVFINGQGRRPRQQARSSCIESTSPDRAARR